MSYLITRRMEGDVHTVCAELNDLHIARFLIQLLPEIAPPSYRLGVYPHPFIFTTCVFRLDSYPDYRRFCELAGDVPIQPEEYFK